jgi:CubicO group peptidase (beta-lactamase class C family)
MKKIHLPNFIIATILLTVFSCKKDDIQRTYKYNPPQQINDGLEVSSINSVGLKKDLIEFMIDNINSNKYVNIHSVLLIKNGKLVLEEYFNGYNQNTLHELRSVSKSVCSALVGIAIDKQYIRSVYDPIKMYLTEYNTIDWTGKENITIYNVLTMSSGLKWIELGTNFGDSKNSPTQMINSPDQVKYVLEQPVEAKPGTKFNYNTGMIITLGKIIKNAVDTGFDEFALSNLFLPMGITQHSWYIYPNSGIYETGGGLRLIPRDMAKFGLLYLNQGKWKGQQIISEEWIKKSIESYFSSGYETYYGFLWWRKPILLLNGQRVDEYHAEGFGGQFIFILPTYKMVVVFTSWNEGELFNQPVEMLQQFILPAIE